MIRLNNGLLLSVYFETKAVQRVTRKGFVFVTETICFLVDGHTLLGVGHAICSPSESYNQGYGYGLALSRAIDDFSDADQDFLDYDDAERIKEYVLDAFLKDLASEQAFLTDLEQFKQDNPDVLSVALADRIPAPLADPYAGVPDADFDI